MERVKVNWLLSIDYDQIPEDVKKSGLRTYRTIQIEREEIEFPDGFTELHTESYKEILAGRGFPISVFKKAIEIVHQIRTAKN